MTSVTSPEGDAMGKGVAQKIIEAHLVDGRAVAGQEIGLKIDQVLIQDMTGTQAIMHFEAMGLPRVRARVAAGYADHNVLHITPENMEDHIYMRNACRKYGIWYTKPAAGIGHQIHQEHFAVPGDTALGADSHTPHQGGVGMVAIGAGGMDVAIAMAGGPYHLEMPEVVNVRLTGQLPPWSTAKDVILELLRRVTVRGGKNKLFEFTGPGIKTLNAQQRVTITNMTPELGATSGVFPSDEVTRDFFRRIGRPNDWREVLPDADAAYDEVIEMDLSTIEPLIALPSLPDKVLPVREVEGVKINQVMVGSCTNGSYTDLQAVARIVKGQRVHPDVFFFVHPSSRQALEIMAKDGMVADLITAGVNLAEPTCGACIGFGHVPAPGTTSLRAINRNFKGRSGLAEDQVYLASAETAAATALRGVITDPRRLEREMGIKAPSSEIPKAMPQENPLLIAPDPANEAAKLEVDRGQNIVPAPVKGPLEESLVGEVLIKLGDDITTDHIMPAGAEIVAFRSNVPRISDYVFHRVDPTFAERAKISPGGLIVGGENYGQGSSREHAAIAPMFLGITGVFAKSFARIHHANLVNWGLIPMVFTDTTDAERIAKGDRLEIPNIRRHIESGATTFSVRNATKGFEFVVKVELNARDRRYLLSGGTLAHTKLHPVVGAA
jgi:aconitate hydratase